MCAHEVCHNRTQADLRRNHPRVASGPSSFHGTAERERGTRNLFLAAALCVANLPPAAQQSLSTEVVLPLTSSRGFALMRSRYGPCGAISWVRTLHDDSSSRNSISSSSLARPPASMSPPSASGSLRASSPSQRQSRLAEPKAPHWIEDRRRCPPPLPSHLPPLPTTTHQHHSTPWAVLLVVQFERKLSLLNVCLHFQCFSFFGRFRDHYKSFSFLLIF